MSLPLPPFHKLPTIRQHPDEESIKNQIQTTRQATATVHKLDTLDSASTIQYHTMQYNAMQYNISA